MTSVWFLLSLNMPGVSGLAPKNGVFIAAKLTIVGPMNTNAHIISGGLSGLNLRALLLLSCL